jgi:cell surface protein SprA
VYSADPAVTPPNLAGVQELAVGIVRVDSIPRGGSSIMAGDSLELWVNDVRLSDVVNDIGMAGEVGVTMNAGDVADFRVNLSRRDPNFRQLNETPSFLTSSGVNVGTTLHLGRMLPARLGLAMPLTIDYASNGVEQLFINRTDVRASGLDNLRNPKDRRVNYALSVRRQAPLEKGWYAPLVNGLALNGTWSTATSQSTFQSLDASSYTVGGALTLGSDVRESRLPRVIDRIVALLPRRLRESEGVKAFREQRLRWAPTAFRLNSSLARNANEVTSFTKAAASLSDTGRVTNGLTHFWQNTAALEFRPTTALAASVNARQLLDLRDYRGGNIFADSIDRGQTAWAERSSLLGANMGLERERALTSTFNFTPATSSWVRPRFDFTSSYSLYKDPNGRTLLRTQDTVGAYVLPKRLGAAQSLNLGTTLDVARLVSGRTRDRTALRRLGTLFAPLDLQWQQSLTSNYDNTAYIPGFGFQFGLGGVDVFRGLDAQLATTAGRLRRGTLAGALNLPFSLTVQSRMEQGNTETWTRRTLDGFQAVITSAQVVRPDITVRWSWRPVRLAKVIALVNVNGRYLLSEQETTIPNETGGLADRSRTIARSQPLSTSITWSALGNLATSASVDRQRREDLRPGAVINGDTKRLSFDVSRTFPLPKSWNTRTGRMRTSVSYQSEETSSIVTGTSVQALLATSPLFNAQTAVLTNNGRRAFNLNANTDLSDLVSFTVTGSQILNFDRNFNRRTSNLIFSAVMQMRFFAGEFR